MITAITAENVNAYKALFEEATEILMGYDRVKMFDAENNGYYFKNIDALSPELLFEKVESIVDAKSFYDATQTYGMLYVCSRDAAEGFDPIMGITTLEEYFGWIKNLTEVSRKYTALPLGSDVFEINANTRAITIPANFKKNGIAVQSDDLAEVLYFRIDRYFDYMDLNNTEIFIQWETPKGADGKPVKGVSSAYLRDIESEPGKLIFGWALSKDITAYAGTLKFSVRFFQWNDGEEAEGKEMVYSFSTLTASATINPSINLNLKSDNYIVDDCGDRLVERLENSVVIGGAGANTPEFTITDLVPNADGYDVDECPELLVQAFAPDAGTLTYTWKRQTLNDDNTPNPETKTFKGTYKYVEVSAEDDWNDACVYYYVEGVNKDGTDFYKRYHGTQADAITHQIQLYVRQAVYLVKPDKNETDVSGIYWAVAENRVANSALYAESSKVVYPRPKDVVITIEPNDTATLGDDGATLTVFSGNTDGVLTFQWYYDANKALNFGGVKPDFKVMEGEFSNILKATEEGHYKVEVTNTRNGSSKSDNSDIVRVTFPAATPVIILPETTADRLYDYEAITDENCPMLTINSEIDSDSYLVEWFRNGETKPLKAEELIGTYVSVFNPKNYVERDEDGNPIIAQVIGSYYPIVTNRLNGSEAKTVKPTDVDDMFSIIN